MKSPWATEGKTRKMQEIPPFLPLPHSPYHTNKLDKMGTNGDRDTPQFFSKGVDIMEFDVSKLT